MPKILFIEDEPNHIALYKTKLEQEGFVFVSAKDSQETFGIVRQEKPDLILLDLLLINENGLEILAQLKKDPKTQNIPVIVFTNYDKAEFREESVKLGANDFIIKAEVTPAQMVEKIKEILGQKNS